MRAAISVRGLTYANPRNWSRSECTPHGRAGLELCQRCRGGVDLVAEDPQVAGAQAAIFAALEFEDGDGHGALF